MYLQCPANSDKGYWFKIRSSMKDNLHFLDHNEIIEKMYLQKTRFLIKFVIYYVSDQRFQIISRTCITVTIFFKFNFQHLKLATCLISTVTLIMQSYLNLFKCIIQLP